MILTHGANSISSGGDQNLIYEFNLSRFNLDTLKDGDLQWHKFNYTSGTENLINLQKLDDCLRLNFSSGIKQGFGILPNDLNLYDSDFSSEVEYSGSYPYTSYCLLMGGAYIQAREGRTESLWTMINNQWGARIYFNVSGKVNVKCYFVKQSNYFDVHLYVGGSFLGTTKSSAYFSGDILDGTNVDYNGVSNAGHIDMHKFVLRRESI